MGEGEGILKSLLCGFFSLRSSDGGIKYDFHFKTFYPNTLSFKRHYTWSKGVQISTISQEILISKCFLELSAVCWSFKLSSQGLHVKLQSDKWNQE